jgi:chemotaxis protein CheC
MKGLDKTSQSAIQEIGNILISHYCSGISDFLKINIYHDVPEVAIGEFFALIDLEIAKLSRYSDQCIILKTKITVKDKPITFDLLFIPYFDSIKKFINWLDVDYIFNLLDSESKTKTLKISSPPPPELLKKKTAKKTTSKKIAKKKKKVSIKKKSVENLKPNTDEPIKSEKDIFSKVQSQKTYQLKTADRINLQMSEADLNTFQELGNIAAGNAGNALSQMLNKKVFLEIPPAKVLDIPDLIGTFGNSKQKMVGYIGTTKGFFESNIFLMFSSSDIENMLRGILDPDMKKKINSKTDLTQNEQSAIMEISNILMGHYISALSDFLRSPIDPPEYQFFFLEPKKLLTKFSQSTNSKDLKAIIVETLINVDQENQIKGQFILILSQIMVKRILDKISEIW